MSTYFDNKGNLRNFPWITADELGTAREHLMSVRTSKPGVNRMFRNRPQNRETEMFFRVEMKDGTRRYGWLTRNDTTDRFTSGLLQENRFNQHIEFIEWDDPKLINCVVGDGLYISESHFFMTHEELQKFLDRMEPAVEMPEPEKWRHR